MLNFFFYPESNAPDVNMASYGKSSGGGNNFCPPTVCDVTLN